MIDYTNCNLDKVAIHQVGNKTNGEEMVLSKDDLDIGDAKLRELLLQFFLPHFSKSEFNSFTFTNGDVNLNPIFQFASQVFETPKSFHKNSVNIARHLFQTSIHPQIKAGDLFIARFSDLDLEEERVSAVGIFKSENRQSFLKLSEKRDEFLLKYDEGINIEKLDKGCLILNTDKAIGYKVCIIDKSSKSTEAQFWKDQFLMLRPFDDDYHRTKGILEITRNYVTKQLTKEFDISKADQIDILNRSIDYFKARDTFDKKEFENEVLEDNSVIRSFRRFGQEYQDLNSMEVYDNFDISEVAVKKQTRVFKSVLKLDKNFHIYIHGSRELIEQGTDRDGRKYYKIYYENEQ